MRKNTTSKRIIAGALAALLIFTALPEGAMAKEPVNEINTMFDKTIIDEDVEVNQTSSLNVEDADIQTETEIASDVNDTGVTFSSNSYDGTDVYYSDIDSEEIENQGAGEEYTVKVDRGIFSAIDGFTYKVLDESGDAIVDTKTVKFAATAHEAEITWESEVASKMYFRVTAATTVDDSWFVFVNGVSVSNDNYKIEVPTGSIPTVVLTAAQLKIEDGTVSLPTYGNGYKATSIKGVSESSVTASDGTIYANAKDSTKVTLSLVAGNDYNLEWGTEKPTPSYVGDNGKQVLSGTINREGNLYTCDFGLTTLANSIKDGAKVITITPDVKATHTVTLSLADDEISDALGDNPTKPSLHYTVYNPDGSIYTAAQNVSSIPKSGASPVAITVPDGGYIDLDTINTGDYNVYFDSAVLTNDSSNNNAVQTFSPDTQNTARCIIKPSNGIAYHGSIKLKYAPYRYKVWQGSEDSTGVGEKGLLRITNSADSSYAVTFTDGVDIQSASSNFNFSDAVTGGYYTGTDGTARDIAFTFRSQDVIKEVSWTYKDSSGNLKTGTYETDIIYNVGGTLVTPLVAPSGGYGIYKCTIPKSIVTAAKSAMDQKVGSGTPISTAVSEGYILSVTITKVPTYVVTMKIDGEDAAKSTHAKLLVYDSEETTRLNEKADSFVVTTDTEILIRVSTDDETDKVKKLKYGLSKITITNAEGSEKTVIPSDKTNYEFKYKLNDTDRDVTIDISTELLNYISYISKDTAEPVINYISGDESYGIQSDPDARKYVTVEYNESIDLQYLIDGQPQILDRDYKVSIDGVELTDTVDDAAGLPLKGEVISISGDGKTLNMKYVKIPGKTVLLEIGGIRKDSDDNIDSLLEKRYIVFNVVAASYKLYVYDYDNGTKLNNPHSNTTSKTTFEVEGGSLSASGAYYLIAVPDTTQQPVVRIRAYVEDANDLKYTLDKITIGKIEAADPVEYSKTEASATGTSRISYTVSSDFEVNIYTSDKSYLAYKYPESTGSEELIGGTITTDGTTELPDTSVENVAYNEEASIEYRKGDDALVLLSSGPISNGDFDIYLNDNKLVGITRTDPDVPSLSEVARVDDKTKLIIDFGQCAAMDKTTVNVVKVVFGVKDDSALERKMLVFEVDPVPFYQITLTVDTNDQADELSAAEVEIREVAQDGTSALLSPVSGSTNVYEVSDQTEVKITSKIKNSKTEQYELKEVEVNETVDEDLSPDEFTYTLNSDTTIPDTVPGSKYAGCVSINITTSEKTYLSYSLDGASPVAVATKAFNDTYDTTSSVTPFNSRATVQYYRGSAIQSLAKMSADGTVSAVYYSATLTGLDVDQTVARTLDETTSPKLSEVASWDNTSNTLELDFNKAAGGMVRTLTVTIGSINGNTLTKKTLTYKIQALPERTVTVRVDKENADKSSIADVTITDANDKPLTLSEGKMVVPDGTGVVIKAEPKEGYETKYSISRIKVTPAGGSESYVDLVDLPYVVKSDVILTIIPDGLPNLLLERDGSKYTYIGTTEEAPVSVNYDQSVTLQYLMGETAQILTGDFEAFVGESGNTEPTAKASAGVVTLGSDSRTLNINFANVPNKTVKIVMGGVKAGSGLEQRQILFTVSALKSYTFTVKIDGAIPSDASHAGVAVRNVTTDTDLIPASDGTYRISVRDKLSISAVISDEIKYMFDRAECIGGVTPWSKSWTAAEGLKPVTFEYTVEEADAVINVITKGLPYVAYNTTSVGSGYLEGASAASKGDLKIDYSDKITVQYMVGDTASPLLVGGDVAYTLYMDDYPITQAGTDIYPSVSEIAKLSADSRTLSLDLSDKKCRDHIFKLVLGTGEGMVKREISLAVSVIYTVNTGGDNDVAVVDEPSSMNNIEILSGVTAGYLRTSSGVYDNDAKADLVFKLCDSIYNSVDDISKVSYRVYGEPLVVLSEDINGNYTISRDILEQFITYNKKVEIILSISPAKYETSLKLAKGADYSNIYYNTDDNGSGYIVATPNWSKVTTARKLAGVELLDADGNVIASYNGASTSGLWAGAIRYSYDLHQNTSILLNPGQTRNYTLPDGSNITYNLPAGNYTILAYAREPYGREVTGKMTVRIGQGITSMEVTSSTQYIYKIKGKAATFKASAMFYGADQKINGAYAYNVEPTTKAAGWYIGDSRGNGLTNRDAFYGDVSFKNGVVTIGKNANGNQAGEFYIWAYAQDYLGNDVRAGRKITVTTDADTGKLTFDKISVSSGQEIKGGDSFEAYELFKDEIVFGGKNYAYDRLVLTRNGVDVTDSFNINISGGAAKATDTTGGMIFIKPGTVNVTATANDGSKNRISFKFDLTYGQSMYSGYELTVGDSDRGFIELATVSLNGRSVNEVASNPMPAGRSLVLTVYGVAPGDRHTLIGNKVTVKGGKITGRVDHVYGTVYTINPKDYLTDIYISDTGSGLGSNLIVHNTALAGEKQAKITAYNINPITHNDNKGRIYNFLNYKSTENAAYFNPIFFDTYADTACNRVIYTIRGVDVGACNVVLLETSNSYLGEIFTYNGFQKIDTEDDYTGLYLAAVSSNTFTIDYTLDPEGYLNIPKGKYPFIATPGFCTPTLSGGEFDFEKSFYAYAKPVKINVVAAPAPVGKVSVSSRLTFNKSCQYGIMKINSSRNIIKASATLDMKAISSLKTYPLKGANKKGVINSFAYDFAIDELFLKNEYKTILKFTGEGSKWLLDDDEVVSLRKAKNNNMLTGYVPYAYQKGDGTVVYDYVKVTIKTEKGLRVF
ncbi:MAG: hypothetical protein IJ058_12090 [Lachnospiraceae bacterium]|nr:hypothetical protein [Lachnospiraceae bacterium]